MKRRIFSFVLALVMTLGLLPAAALAEGEGYGDVPERYWAADAIKRWSESGVVSGSNGLFRPNDTMTRVEAASVFAKLLGLTDDAAKTAFPDLREGYWGYGVMNKAINAGILTGTADGLADPNGTLTREQFFVMLARALGLEEQATTSGLPADGGMWSAGYINALTDRGYVSGTSVNGVLAVNARSAITRASAMKLLDQAIPADKAEEEPAPVVAAHTSGAGGGSTSTSTTTTTTTKHEENEPYALRTIQQIFADAAKEDAGKNIAYSPANLYLALCMLAETAGGDSRAQLLDLLEVSSVEEARATAKALWDELYKNDDEGKTLLANSLWMNEQSTFHENTTDILKNDHRAEAFREPMGVKATDEKIEDWISEKTEHMLNLKIKTNPFTLMMLVSALYFKGSWEDAFNKALTHEDVFTSVKGEEQRIDFMHRTETDSFYHGNGFTAASLPFKDTTKMWFLLPDEGTDISMDALARVATLLNSGDGELERGIIEWSVPKFDIERSLNLNATMKALGVTDIFDSYLADFSPLTDQDMVIDLIRHAVRVKVDEEGAEAAAVTIIEGNTTSGAPIPLPVIEMDLDRPFGFLITGTDDLPLFVGVVNTVVEEN